MGNPRTPSGCHCLCTANHPFQRGICTLGIETGLRFFMGREGWIEVPMCEACAESTLREAEAREEAREWQEPGPGSGSRIQRREEPYE